MCFLLRFHLIFSLNFNEWENFLYFWTWGRSSNWSKILVRICFNKTYFIFPPLWFPLLSLFYILSEYLKDIFSWLKYLSSDKKKNVRNFFKISLNGGNDIFKIFRQYVEKRQKRTPEWREIKLCRKRQKQKPEGMKIKCLIKTYSD